MDKTEADKQIAYADTGQPVRLILGYKSAVTEGGISLGRVAVADDAQSRFKTIADSVLADRVEREPEDWEPARPVSPETYLVMPCADVGQVPLVTRSKVQPLLAALLDTDGIREMDGSSLRKADPLFYAFQFGVGDESVTFLRKMNPMRGLRKKWFGLLDDELRLIDEPLFAFDAYVDLIITRTTLFVFSQSAFAGLFRRQSDLDALAKNWIEKIRLTRPMTDESFSLLVNKGQRDSRIIRRIEAISRRGHLANITTSQLRSGMKKCDLDPERHLNSRGELVITEENLSETLKFLNEDMFKGVLTDDPFEADSKALRH